MGGKSNYPGGRLEKLLYKRKKKDLDCGGWKYENGRVKKKKKVTKKLIKIKNIYNYYYILYDIILCKRMRTYH